MRKVTKHVAVVEARHGDLRNNHLQESRECGKDTEFVFVKTKTSRSRKVAALHDTGGDEHLRVPLVYNFQTS